MKGLNPVQPTPLYQRVAQELERYIHINHLKPGDRLPSERELAERLQVSRTVVRESLRMLNITGFVNIRIGQGAYVGEPEMANLLSVVTQWIPEHERGYQPLMEAREALEVYATGLAAERSTPKDIAYMERILRETELKIETGDNVLEEDIAFHQSIFEATGNPILLRLLRIIGEGLVTIRQRTLEAGQTACDVVEDHRRVLEALKTKDRAAAEDAMRTHLSRVKRALPALER